MAYTITIGGTTASVLNSSLQITDNINDRSSCTFIYDTTASVTVGSEVIITDGINRIFGGTIDSYRKTPIFKGSNLIRHDITCIDFNQAGDRIRVAKAYENKTSFEITNDIISTYLTAEGVTTGTLQTGANISKATFNRKTVTECLNYIKDATGVNWNIDYFKKLQTFYKEDNLGLPLTESDMIEINVEQTRQDYRNRQYIRAGQDETDLIQRELPTPKPDGNSKTFVVRYPLGKVPTVIVNDVTVSATSVGINGLDTGKEWYWNKNERVLVQDNAQTTLSNSDTLKVTYTGLVKILVQADNVAGQEERATVENNTGIYEAIEDIASIDDRQSALDYANGLLTKYANISQIVSIRTRAYRQAGQLVNLTHTNLGIEGQYLIDSVNISDIEGNLFYDIRCLSGESLGSWVEFFRKLRKDSSDLIINQDEVLVILKTFTEALQMTGTDNIKTSFALYPSDTLYPSNTLYPNTAIVSEVTLSD